MALKIWLHDRLVDEKEATVSVFDHGLLYGDGVFEGIRVYGGRIFELDAHLKRLCESARVIRLEIPLAADKLSDAVYTTVKANNIADGYIRLIVTRGVGDLGLNPFICRQATVIIIAADIQLYGEQLYRDGLKVISSSVMRIPPLSLPAQVKSLNYLSNIMAKIECVDAGSAEAIMYNHEGFVAEGTADNVFIVKNGVIYTPPIQAGALEGITRKVVIRLAIREGMEVVEKNLTRFDLYTADEMFLTGTAAEVIAVTNIDGRIIGTGRPGPVTGLLRERFSEYARS